MAALYLSEDPAATPDVVHQAVVGRATLGKLSGIGSGSPNRLLYSLFGAPPPDGPPLAAFTSDCGGLTCRWRVNSVSGGGSYTFWLQRPW